MPWDDDLQPGPAREFASAAARHLRALAGPGAGKSYSLRRRVARLIEEFVPSERIFVVTFTRTAAQDLVASLRDLGESVDGVDVRTLHSFCFSMLSREGVLR